MVKKTVQWTAQLGKNQISDFWDLSKISSNKVVFNEITVGFSSIKFQKITGDFFKPNQ